MNPRENKGSIALARNMEFKEEGGLHENVLFDHEFHDSLVFVLFETGLPPNLRSRLSSQRDTLS